MLSLAIDEYYGRRRMSLLLNSILVSAVGFVALFAQGFPIGQPPPVKTAPSAVSATTISPPAASTKPSIKNLTTTDTYLVEAPGGQMVAPDIAQILKRGELVVAMVKTDSAPFFSEKDGEHIGTDVELARAIAKELGVPVRFDRTSKTFDAAVQMAADGRADLAMGRLARTLSRARSVSFSTSYMRLAHSFLINRLEFAKIAGERTAPNVIRNFTGTLGVIGGSAWEEFGRRNFPKAKIVPYPSWAEAVAAVKKGTVVAIYRDEFEIQQIMRADPGLALNLRTVTFGDIGSSLSVMAAIKNVALLAFVDEVITQRTEVPSVKMMLKDLNK